jgi:cathepsin A (carboxypeptidase C)
MEDAARDMNAFFRIFFTEMFPQFSNNSLHIAGESFGGHWVPSFVTHISKRQRLDVPGTFSGTIDSMILLDAVVSYMTSGPGASYDHFCSPGSRVKFNQTACQAMAATAPECDFLSRHCTDKYDVYICTSAFEYCSNVHARWYNEYGPDLPDPYDDRHVCDLDAFACGGFDMRFVEYLNTDEVKMGLGVNTAFEYKVFNAAINRAWGERAAIAVPTTREVSYILDDTATRVLVVNGNNDIIVCVNKHPGPDQSRA